MIRHQHFYGILGIFCVTLICASAAAQPSHILGQDETTVIPERFLRGYDPITVFFEEPPLGPNQHGPVDLPETLARQQIFELSPAHPGDYIWIDGKTLQFLPTTDWPALEQFTLQVQGAAYPLFTFMDEPVEVWPRPGRTHWGELKEITLSFRDPLDMATLAEMIVLEVEELPGVDDRKQIWLTQEDFALKQLERASLSEPVQYQLTLHKAISYGKHVTLHLKLSLDDTMEGSLAQYSIDTEPLFRVTGIGADYNIFPIASGGSVFSKEQPINRDENRNPLVIDFSNNLGPVSMAQVKQFVHFEPAVENLRFEASWSRLLLYFDSDSDRLYKVSLTHVPLHDEKGRELATFGPTEAYFYYPHATPFLRWTYSQGIVERYGPQMFPMEGRGDEQVDLRIYKLDPLDRNFWPFPDHPVEVDESQRPPGPGEEPQFATNMVEHIQLLGSPLISKIVPLPMKDFPGDLHFGLDLKSHFARISGVARPGTYLVGYRRLGSSTIRSYVRVQVTDLSLSTVEEESGVNFVVTSLSSGDPVAGASVVVEGQFDNNQWKPILSGTTDSDGQFLYQHTSRITATVKRIIVTYGDDRLVLNPDVSPPQFANNHWYNARSAWLGWLNDPPIHEKEQAWRKTHIFTERPVYRPEEPVHIKGYIRYWRQGRLELPSQPEQVTLTVRGPGNKQWSYNLDVTEAGSFYMLFDEKDLPSGEYEAYIEKKYGHETTKTVTFKKESYRIPRFEVNISGPEKVSIDEPFKLIMTADYYAGGRVVDQEVTWQVTRYSYNFAPPDYPGFLFSSMQRFSQDEEYWGDDVGDRRETDRTDSNGASELLINPTKEPDARPREYIVEATVRGADEQTVTNTKVVKALPPFVLGMKVERFLKHTTAIRPELLVLNHLGEPMKDKTFRLRVYQRQWHSYLVESDFTTGKAQYVNDVVDKLLSEQMLTSQDAPFVHEIPVHEAGVYVLEISAQDKLGRLQKVSADLFVAGDTPVAWEKPPANVFEIVTDQSKYDPGDTAQLVFKSPFQEAKALVVVEEPLRNQYHWVDVRKGQGMFSLPITGDMTPSIPVHVLLLRGRVAMPSAPVVKHSEEQAAQIKDRARPIAMGSTVWITVRPKAKQLQVAVEHPDKALPGTSIPIKILLNDPDGNPLNGEVTLWLVDRAVLALGKEQPLDPVPSFIQPNPSYVRIRDLRNDIIGEIPIEEMPGGDGARERPDLFDNVTVRKNFKTVPYYNPAIQVIDGVAEVIVDLPDNLTDFAIRAVATDGLERFGFTKSRIAVRLPLIVQSALPRFVRPGDQFVAGGIGRVVEGDGGPGLVQLQVEGLDVDGDLSRSISWVKDQAEQLYFPMTVTREAALTGDEARVTVRLAVKRDVDGASDAFEMTLPVKQDRHQEKADRFAQLTPSGPFALLSPEDTPRAGSVTQHILLTYEPALVKMLAGLNYLAGYEHSCVEQRISRLLPELVLQGLLEQLSAADRREVIQEPMEETFKYLERVQQPNGLYSYWPGSRGYISLTAYVVDFLLAAKDQGYVFEERLLGQSLKVLNEALRSDYTHFIDGKSFAERVDALATLARAGEFDEGYAQEFLARALSMNLYTEAKILESFLDYQPENQKAISRLQDDLWSSLIFKLRDGEEAYHGLQYRAQSWGGLINSSEVKTLASVAKALHKSAPQDARVRLLIEELIARGDGDGWGSTNANAAALLALGQVLDTPQPPQQGHVFTLTFGEQQDELTTADTPLTRYQTSTPQAGTLAYQSGPKDAMPLLWNSLSYFPAEPGDTVTQENSGFVVDRELLLLQADDAPFIKKPVQARATIDLSVGTVVEEHLRVVNPEDRYFVAIRAPFAAGFDPLNPNLATAPPEARPSGSLTLKPDYALYEDDQVTFYYDTLPKGAYDFYFRLKATFAGSFVHPAAKAELMYKQTVYGNSAGTRIVIAPRAEE